MNPNKRSKVWCAHTGKLMCTLLGDGCDVTCVDISPDNHYVAVATASSDETCKLYDLLSTHKQEQQKKDNNNINCIRTFEGHEGWVIAVKFTTDAKYIVTSSYDHTLVLWCVESGNKLRTFSGGHARAAQCVAISSDNEYIISGKSEAILWNLKSGEKLQTYKGHDGTVLDVSISSENAFVITASDCIVNIWDRKNGNVIYALTGHTDDVTSMVLSSDDKLLVTTSYYDKTVRIKDLTTLPNIPGMAWKIIRPFVMLRWLVTHERASPKLLKISTKTSNVIKTNNDDTDDNGHQDKKLTSGTTTDEQVLISLIIIKFDDVFKHILSFLFAPPITIQQQEQQQEQATDTADQGYAFYNSEEEEEDEDDDNSEEDMNLKAWCSNQMHDNSYGEDEDH